MFGLPYKVKFCTRCTLSNQRPVPVAEFKTKKNSKKQENKIDDNLVCNACKVAERKKEINWREREKELIKLCNKFRSKKMINMTVLYLGAEERTADMQAMF